MTVSLAGHAGAPLVGGRVDLDDGTGRVEVGVTGAGGEVSTTLTAGSYTVYMTINGTEQSKPVALAGEPPDVAVGFQTGRVAIHFTGEVWYGSGGAVPNEYTAPVEMLPGTYGFEFSGGATTETTGLSVVAGDDIAKTALYTRLTDSAGTGIGSAPISGFLPDGGDVRTWYPMGATNGAGAVLYLHDGLVEDTVVGGYTSVKVVAPAGGVGTVDQDPASDSFYGFATAQASATLADYVGGPLAGGTASIFADGTWQDVGTTDASGTIAFEALPGTHSLAMAYNGTSEQRDDVDPTAGPIAYQTGRFDIRFTGDLSWGLGPLYPYSDPEQVMPGDYDLSLSRLGLPAHTAQLLTVSAGDDLLKTAVYARFADAAGTGLSGGSAEFRSGGWQPMGTTDGNGAVAALFDGALTGNHRVRMTYNGTNNQENHNVATDSFYEFETIGATIDVLDALGAGLAGIDVEQNAGGWSVIGTTDAAGQLAYELMPGHSRSYRVSYGGATQTQSKAFTVGDATLTFQSVLARIQLLDSSGAGIAGVDVLQNVGGWQVLGTTDSVGEVTFELMSGQSRQYRISHNGTTQTQSQAFAVGDDILTFQTVLATIEVIESDSDPIAGVDVLQNAGGWRTIGTTDAAGEVAIELLPGHSRQYRASYGGTRLTLAKAFVPGDQTLTFQTVLGRVELLDSTGTGIAGIDVEQSDPWHVIGTTDASGEVSWELMPGQSRTYQIWYHGTRQRQGKAFTAGDQTLTFQTLVATFEVTDAGAPVAGVDVQQRNGSWQVIGTTDTSGEVPWEVLPGYRSRYRVSYGGETQTQNKAFISGDDQLTLAFNVI